MGGGGEGGGTSRLGLMLLSRALWVLMLTLIGGCENCGMLRFFGDGGCRGGRGD